MSDDSMEQTAIMLLESARKTSKKEIEYGLTWTKK